MNQFVRRYLFAKALVGATLLAVSLAASAAYAQSTWNTATGTWNTAGNWSPSGVPTSASTRQLVFNASGTTSYTTTNNIGTGTFTLNRITVNNTGTGIVTIAGAAAGNTLTMSGTNPTLDITGTTLFTGLFANSTSIRKIGTGIFIHDSNNTAFKGTLTIDAGTFINRATTNATTNFDPVSIVVNNGGTYQFGDNGVGNPNLPNNTYITLNSGGAVTWDESEDFGGINLKGGALNLRVSGYNAQGATAQSWESGTLTGGAFAASGTGVAATINKTTAGTVTITGGATVAGSGTLNILEGTVSHVNAANLGAKGVNLGGATTSGTFEYQGTSASRGGDFTLNAGGGTVAVTNANSLLTLSGAFSGAGNLSKTGAGTLHLTGALSSSGTTTISAGALRVNPGTAAGAFAVQDGGTLAINAGDGSSTFTAPAVALTGANPILRFELNNASVPTATLMTISAPNGLTGTGRLSVLNQQAMANGTYKLIGYSGTPISSGFNLKLPGRTIGSLDYGTVGEINAIVTGSDSLKWGGQIDGVWDTGTDLNVGGTSNWRLASNNSTTNFVNTDSVQFDDSASGNFNVALSSVISPSGVVMINNSANDYSFSGSGGIGGTAALSKQGTGTLAISTLNTYTGATSISAGSLVIGTGGSIASSSALNVSGGTISTALTTAVLPGTVNLTGGTLSVPTLGALGTTAAISLNGGTLAVTGDSVNNAAHVITVGSSGGTIDVSNGVTVSTRGTQLLGPGNTLTKTGFGTLTIGSSGTSTVGTYQVNNGILQITSSRIGSVNAINIANDASFVISDTTSITNLSMATGATLSFAGDGFNGQGAYRHVLDEAGNATTTISQAISLPSTARFTMDNRNSETVTDTFSGVLSGAGGIIKDGEGTMILSGANNYAGSTTVSAGTLSLTGNGAIADGSAVNVIVASGIFSVSGITASGETVGSLAGVAGSSVVLGAKTLVVGGDNTSTTFAGIASGTGGALTKTGTGTMTLSGVNTFTGATNVNAGTLVVDGSTAAGAVNVASGASLTGSGTINGSVQFTSGAIHSPGNSPGLQTVSGATYAMDSIFEWELFDNTNSNISMFDRVAVTTPGALAINSGAKARLIYGGTVDPMNSFWDADKSWNVFSFTGTAPTSVFTTDGGSLVTMLASRGSFSWSKTDSNVVLNYTAVPEPTSLVFGFGLGVAGLITAYRRRKAKNTLAPAV